MTIEDSVYDYIEAARDAAIEGDALYQAELHDTVYQTIQQDYGVRIGDCESQPSPLPGGLAMEEFDADLVVVCFARVAGPDKTDRRAARNQARGLMLAVAKLFYDDLSMGGRVRDALVGRCKRGWDSSTEDDEYAVVNIPLIVNRTGQQIDRFDRYER